MPCIGPDGTLTPVAAEVLRAAGGAAGATADDIARVAGVPLYRARASLRELVDAGLLAADAGRYRATPAGSARLARAS